MATTATDIQEIQAAVVRVAHHIDDHDWPALRAQFADEVQTHLRAYHVKQGAPGGDEWLLAGHYAFGLRRIGTGWKIRKMKLLVTHQSGNLTLLQ